MEQIWSTSYIFKNSCQYVSEIDEQEVDSPKEKILQFIIDNPSVHLRKIKKNLGYSMGTTQYHVSSLENEGKIISKRSSIYKNYYHVGINTKNELMAILNLESPRKIILYVLENEPCNHGEIAKGVGLTSSTISWHMKKLIEFGVIGFRYDGKYSIYSIRNKEELVPLLRYYKSSTWNDMINNMTDLFSAFQE